MVGLKWIMKIFIILATVCHLCTGYIDMARYKQMPPLYLADDYDQCLRQESTSYCLIYAEIQPQPESSVWQYMDEFYKNSTETHYRHDQLYRGVCTSRCRDYPKSYDRWNVREVQPTSDNVEMTRKLYTISRGQKSISEYEQQLHQCVNSEMMQKYNLSVKTFVKYCDNPKEPIEKDSRYSLAIIVFIAIIVINLLSTAYDVYLKSQQNERESIDYYDTKHKNTVNNYLTLFSLYRNFRRLVKPNNSAIGKDLSCIDGFRTIMSMVIVFEHVMLMQFFPLKNPELLETEYSSTSGRWLSHLMPCIELFFVMTGLMLYIKFAKSEYITPTSSWGECMRVYVRMMISRYFRYIPSLLLLIFFTSHILLYIGDGPFWRFSVEPSVLICRNEWWRNLLMIANGDPNDTCCVHTWYIAADFQLYAIFLAVLVITSKCPQYKRLIYTIVGIIGLSTPSIINYMKKLNSITTLMMENFRHFHFKGMETTLSVYFKSYTNLNGAFVGIICGELYMNYLKHDKYKKIVGRYLHLAPLFGWAIIFSIWYWGTFIIFKENTIWTSMFAIIHRHLSIAIVATVVILRGICTGGGFLSWPIFRPLARVSYQVYLWHLIILFTLFSSFRQPIESSYFWLAYTHAFIYFMSAIIATVIATMVEYPIVEILALFDMKSRQNINRHLKSERA